MDLTHAPVIRMNLVAAAAACHAEAMRRGGNPPPVIEAVGRLVDDALTLLDTYGTDLRGAPPEDWQAA